MFTAPGLFGALLGLLLAQLVSSAGPKVLIIGAGPSGIAAGSKLVEKGFDVTVLEAEVRIGGRIHSVKFGDAYVDLGAHYCHGEKDNIVYQLAKDLNLLGRGKMDMNYHYSGQFDPAFFDELFGMFEEIQGGIEEDAKGLSLGEVMTQRYNETVSKQFGEDEEKLKLAWDFFEFAKMSTMGLDGSFSWFNVAAVDHYKKCEGNLLLNWKGQGYRTILDVLRKKIPHPEEELPLNIALEKEVKEVKWGEKVEVVLSNQETFSADHVIFTPSLGVLKSKAVAFDPPLPQDKLQAIEDQGFDAIQVAAFHFPERWWPENFTDAVFVWSGDDEGDFQAKGRWIQALVSIMPAPGNPHVLEGWFVGEFVPQIEELPDDVFLDGVAFSLKKFLKNEFDVTDPDSFRRFKWYSNPHFRGSYSYETPKKRDVAAQTVLAQPLEKDGKPVLLFAGEATHLNYYSTVHGAIETGFREAQRLIDLYSTENES